MLIPRSLVGVAISLALTLSLSAGAFDWQVPRQLEQLEVPGETWADGTPVRLHVVRSKEHPENLLRDFIRAAKAQGLYLPPPSAQPLELGGVQATALDPAKNISYTLILQPEPGDTVAVIVAEADLSRRKKRAGNTELPLPPGASAPLVARLEGEEIVSFDVGGGVDVVGFYRTVALKAGLVPEGKDGEGRFTGPGGTLDVRVSSGERGRQDVVVRWRAGAGPGR